MPERIKLRYPLNALASYHYYKKNDMSALHRGGLRVIADSGAYSAAALGSTIDQDEFAGWAIKWRDSLAWIAGLDVIGNDAATYRNWQSMRRTYHLDFVPTIHYGVTGDAMDKYVDEGVDYIGLGGMVPFKSEPKRLLRWALAMFRYARDNHPHVRFHGWGVTHPDLITNLPWYSVDSSGWGAAYRYGRLALFDQRQGKFVGILCDGKDAHRHRVLVTKYGVTPADIAKSTPANRPLLCRVSARSYQALEDHLRARHPVSAPTYGLNTLAGRPAGPNVHLATSGPRTETPNLLNPDAGSDGVHVHLATTTPLSHDWAALATPGSDLAALAGGAHIHLAEGSYEKLANLTAPTDPTQEQPA